MNVEELKPTTIEISEIFLDPNNPRFTKTRGKVTEKKITNEAVQAKALEYISKFGIDDLINSILRNGFLPLDRIVVREISGFAGKYVVVEGNRRTAAIKLLRDRIETGEVDEEEYGEDVLDELMESTKNIECLVYTGTETSDIAWILQGVRHIGGIKEWAPAQQAELVTKEVDENGLSARQVGEMLGISTQRVNRLYRGYKGLRQMLDDEEYMERAQKDYFTLFEQAYQKTGVREWLGWNNSKGVYENTPNLKKFYEMISPDPQNDDRRRIHNPNQITSLERLVVAGRFDLISKILDHEISVDEAKGRLDESAQVVDWKEELSRASEAIALIPATALAEESTAVLAELAKLKNSVETLVVIAESAENLAVK